ncbi:MAG: hypothetical protein QW063_01775 [Candidatus Nanoarchaeia archaeon]
MAIAHLDRVLAIVKQQPVLPIEVASKLNLDSFLAKAFLDQLVEAGAIKASSEKIGGVPVYFVAGQEIIADQKIKKLMNTKPTAKQFATVVPQGAEVEKKRAEFLARLKEIEQRERELAAKKIARMKTIAIEPIKVTEQGEAPELVRSQAAEESEIKTKKLKEIVPQIIVEKPGEDAPKVEVKSELERPKLTLLEQAKKFLLDKTAPTKETNVVDASLAWLTEKGAEIVSKELKKKGKEAIITAAIPSNIGPIKFLVFVLNKKSISENDLSIAYSIGMQKKFPVIVISKGKLSKAAQKHLTEIGEVVKFKQLE